MMNFLALPAILRILDSTDTFTCLELKMLYNKLCHFRGKKNSVFRDEQKTKNNNNRKSNTVWKDKNIYVVSVNSEDSETMSIQLAVTIFIKSISLGS